MSIAERQALIDDKHTIFQRNSQRTDLLNPDLTQTGLIALLESLVAQGHYILFTAVRSDHHDDSSLGYHCHAHGFAADCWPLNSPEPTDFIAASDPLFQAFLKDCAKSEYLYQIGLAGSAQTEANRLAAGSTVFADDGADHIHLGAQ